MCWVIERIKYKKSIIRNFTNFVMNEKKPELWLHIQL